jgi:hypothetical protein
MLVVRIVIFFIVIINIQKYGIADKELENAADEGMHASESSIHEEVDAAFAKTVMKSKRYLGMGIGNKYEIVKIKKRVK